MSSKPEVDVYKKIAELRSWEYSSTIKAKLASIHYLKEQVAHIEDTEMEKELLDLTATYNSQFKQIEESMSKVIKGENSFELPQSVITKYNLPQYDKEKIREIPSYWLTVLKNSDFFTIEKEEENLLMKLKDITINVHDDNLSYTLNYYFEENDRFGNDILYKTYYLDKKTKECYKTEASEIQWKNDDEQYKYSSFFSMFTSHDEEDDYYHRKMDQENEEGDSLKNDMIPFSLEFYLNLMNNHKQSD